MLLNKLTWQWASKFAAMKGIKITWPADGDWRTTLIVSLDGTHSNINEPRDPTMRKNPKWYSHKFNLPGLNYEVCLHLWENRCVWAKTQVAASVHDLTAFRGELKGMIPAGKRVICDSGYYSFKDGEDEILSFPNSMDTEDVRNFKNAARARQENWNKRIKDYGCINERFRHGVVKHQICFDACAVLVQYAIEDTTPGVGEPLNTL